MASFDKEGKIIVYLPEDYEYEKKQLEGNPAYVSGTSVDEPLWANIKSNIVKLEEYKKKHWDLDVPIKDELSITNFFKKNKRISKKLKD